MGRIFGNQPTTTQPQNQAGGRIFGNKTTETKKQPTVKNWEDYSLWEKNWAALKEIPNTLFGMTPPVVQEAKDKPLDVKTFLPNVVKGATQFLGLTADAIIKGIGGGILGGKELGLRKPQSFDVNIGKTAGDWLGTGEKVNVSSWQQQTKQLESQGFSKGEAAALTGINAYLVISPELVRAGKSVPIQKMVDKITTKSVPIADTPAGIKQTIKTGEAPAGTTRIERPIVTKTKELFNATKEQQSLQTILNESQKTFYSGVEDLVSPIRDPLNKALLELSDSERADFYKVAQGFEVTESPKLKSVIELWKETNKKETEFLIENGKLTEEIVNDRRWAPVEKLTGRSRIELQEMGVDPVYYPYIGDFSKKSDFVLSKGQRYKPNNLKEWTGKMLMEDTYIKDPKIVIPRNRVQVFKNKINGELMQSIVDNFAEKDPAIIKELKKNPALADELGLSEWKPSGSLKFYPLEEGGLGVSTKVETHWIPDSVKSELVKIAEPSKFEKLLRLTYDPLMDTWRIPILNLAPRWIYNNTVGNTILYTLGKGDLKTLLFDAPKELAARTKVGEKLGIAKRDLPEGVLQKEYAGGETASVSNLGKLPGETTQLKRSINNWMTLLDQAKQNKVLKGPALITDGLLKGLVAIGKPGAAVNKTVENLFRTALYITKSEGKFLGMKLEKGAGPAESLRYVNEFLFDYSNLSRTERTLFRRVSPFWNWQKNITKFSFNYPVNHPIRGLTAAAMLQDYVDYINEVNQKDDSNKSIMRIKIGDTKFQGKPMYLNIKSALPFSDIFNILPTGDAQWRRIFTSNPVSKIVFERISGINAFTGQPFSKPPQLQEYDEYGKPILERPNLLKHIGMQVPQTKLIKEIADYAKYGTVLNRYELGQPKIYQNKLQTIDLVSEILKYFGINTSATDYEMINKNTQKKEKQTEKSTKKYERTVEQKLKQLINQ